MEIGTNETTRNKSPPRSGLGQTANNSIFNNYINTDLYIILTMRYLYLNNTMSDNRMKNMSNLLCKQKIADMSYRAKKQNSGVSEANRDAAIRRKLDQWVIGEGTYELNRDRDVIYIDGQDTSFRISGITSDIILENFPEYRFGKVKNFTLYNCKMKSLLGFPEEINGDLRLEKCTKNFSEENKEKYLSFKVTGNVTITECPYLSKNNFIDNSIVEGEITDDKEGQISDSYETDDDCPFTEGQQLILDYASDLGDDLFSVDEWNDLEQFFRDQC